MLLTLVPTVACDGRPAVVGEAPHRAAARIGDDVAGIVIAGASRHRSIRRHQREPVRDYLATRHLRRQSAYSARTIDILGSSFSSHSAAMILMKSIGLYSKLNRSSIFLKAISS